jgi:hypothetical protein
MAELNELDQELLEIENGGEWIPSPLEQNT